MTDVASILQKYKPDITRTMQAALANTPDFIGGVVRYHLGWVDKNFEPATLESGKMLRPALCLMVFEALSGEYHPALPAAAAIEMIHNFSLLHDDIEDNDHERRGRPTAWTIWGKPLSINTGDYLYTLAFETLLQLDPARFSAAQRLAVQQLVTRACLNLTLGQDLDLRFEQDPQVTTEMYIDMVYKKTGALLEATIAAGATLGSDDSAVIDNYRAFARNIGIAFQIRDDILGIWGDAARTGKSTDNDLRRKKKTLPLIYTLNRAEGARREKLAALYADSAPLSDDDISFVRASLAWVEAKSYAQQNADRYILQAFEALAATGVVSQPQTDLETIARYLIERSR